MPSSLRFRFAGPRRVFPSVAPVAPPVVPFPVPVPAVELKEVVQDLRSSTRSAMDESGVLRGEILGDVFMLMLGKAEAGIYMI